ncbi:unnamed protein product, partial [Linum tenue]
MSIQHSPIPATFILLLLVLGPAAVAAFQPLIQILGDCRAHYHNRCRDDQLYCNSWRLSVEANNSVAWTEPPKMCADYVMKYFEGEQYSSDQEVSSVLASSPAILSGYLLLPSISTRGETTADHESSSVPGKELRDGEQAGTGEKSPACPGARLAASPGRHWFQNRRARFKNKQLKRDFDSLRANFDRLKADYSSLLHENETLKNKEPKLLYTACLIAGWPESCPKSQLRSWCFSLGEYGRPAVGLAMAEFNSFQALLFASSSNNVMNGQLQRVLVRMESTL